MEVEKLFHLQGESIQRRWSNCSRSLFYTMPALRGDCMKAHLHLICNVYKLSDVSAFSLHNKCLCLQIPEVRLNIISNLDCVNQGEMTITTQLQ